MRIPLCILALTMSAWAANVDTPDVPDAPQASAPAAPAPDAKPPDPPAKLGGFVISGVADGYFNLNLNHPSVIGNQLQNFDINWGQPELSLAKITVDKSDKVIGFHFDVGTGETMRWIHAFDPASIDHKALRYVEQMYVIAKPNNTHGTEIDYGQFVTSAGAEVIEANANWNYSRSILFAWAIPYYHFGLKTATPVTKTWTVGFQLVNAWNTVWGNNNMKNIGLTSAVTTTKYMWALNYYEGPNHVDAKGASITAGKRNLVDTTLMLMPNSKVNFYVNADYGRDNNSVGPGYATWYGLAGAAHVQLTSKISVSPRVEFFNDKNGYNTGTNQVLKEGTLTGEYKYNDHLIGRVEIRHDASDHAFFDRGAVRKDGTFALSKTETTATLGLMYVLGPYK